MGTQIEHFFKFPGQELLAKAHLKAVYNNSEHKVQVLTYCGPNSVDFCLLLSQEQ